MSTHPIHPGSIIRGPTLPEAVEVLALVPFGESLKVIGRGLSTGLTYDPVLNPAQLAQLTVSADREPFDRGFDLISRRPHSEDPKTFIEVRFIEVKGRAGVGVVALSANEFHTAERLKTDYWLYIAFNCAGSLQLHTVHNPARLGWKAVMSVEHYQIGAVTIRSTAET